MTREHDQPPVMTRPVAASVSAVDRELGLGGIHGLVAQLVDCRLPLQRRRTVTARIGALAGNRALQRALITVQRETANEIIELHTNWGGLNLNEEAVGEDLAARVRRGDYRIVTAVLTAERMTSSNRDDVATETLRHLDTQSIIRIAKNPTAVQMLRIMKNEMTDLWSWVITDEERRLADLIAAILNDPGARNLWNRQRILEIKASAGNDLAALAQLFDSDEIVDDGTLQSRTAAVLDVTAHLVIPGLQTGIDFGDTGFAGDQRPGGAGFRDPHPSSRNQVGHFLTAVGLEFSPGVVSTQIPALRLVRAAFGAPDADTVREMIHAPASMSDADVALRLTIGHEKAPDPNGTNSALSIAIAGVGEMLAGGPDGETDEQRDERVGRAVIEETRRQILEVIHAFKRQFDACTDDDVATWNRAIAALGSADQLNIGAAQGELSRIAINFAQRGNSIQDMRLSLVGWRLGQMLSSGAFGDDRRRVAAWIRTNLGG